MTSGRMQGRSLPGTTRRCPSLGPHIQRAGGRSDRILRLEGEGYRNSRRGISRVRSVGQDYSPLTEAATRVRLTELTKPSGFYSNRSPLADFAAK
ncbi:hypothetical protein GCM10009744_12590 [Kribbella alba]|uniref:Uncharacterized protein n=1 Tax=Kribbella alba TaxID=190197 RepID=A0ABP4QWS5_9ACTN